MVQTTPPSERMAQEMQLLRAVRGFSDAQDRMYGGMKHGMKMNTTDLAALRLIIIREEQQRSVSPHEIANHLRISTASTTKLLDRLTSSGHVRRAPHATDRRARVVELTDAARAEFFKRFGPQLTAMRAAFEEFSDEELDAAARVIEAVSAAIDPAAN